ILTVLLALFSPYLVQLFLGTGFSFLAHRVQILVLGAVPFCLYYVLRGVIDAFHRNGVNTLNLFFAFLAFLALVGLGLFITNGVWVVLASFVASIYFLALLTLNETRKILARKVVTERLDRDAKFEEIGITS